MSSTPSPKNAERRKKLGKVGKGTLALVLAAGALSSGTYALWNNTATSAAGTISSGRLDAKNLTVTNHDVSGDRLDATTAAPLTSKPSHSIPNLGTYKTVPGDTLQVNIPFDLALDGDNLSADLVLDVAGTPTGTPALANTGTATDGVTVTYDVYNKAGVKLNTTAVAWGTDYPSIGFQADSTGMGGANPTGDVLVPKTLDNVADVTVVVTATFSSTATADQREAAQAALGNIAGKFNQVRTGAGFGTPTVA